MRIFLILFCLFFSYSLFSAGLSLPINARQNSSCGLLLDGGNVGDMLVNPAFSTSGIETSYTRLLGFDQLPCYTALLVKNFSSFGSGIGCSYLDNELYKESKITAAANYGWERLSLGLAASYLSVSPTGFESLDALSLDLGLVWRLDAFSSSIAYKNILEARLEDTPLPVVVLWETGWRLSDKTLIGVGWEKEKGFDFCFKFASLYNVSRVFQISAGYQYEPDRLGLGAKFNLNRKIIGYGVRTHAVLGLTHHVTLSYLF
jgi:hypothetical protein